MKQLILENGYEMTTTFWDDFSIADRFGIPAIKDTFKRAFESWRDNYVYLTELVIVLNHKIWEWHAKNEAVARVYNDLWMQADIWACETLDGDEATFFYRTTD